MDPVILGTIGLISGMAGAALVFWYGVPPSKETWGYSQPLDKDVETIRWGTIPHKEALAREQTWYDGCRRRSRIGLALIFIGFLVQLWSLYPNFLNCESTLKKSQENQAQK